MLKFVVLVFLTAVTFCLLCIMGATAVKAGDIAVEIEDLSDGDLVARGFELAEKSEIKITGVAASAKYGKNLFAFGWIIDAESRDLVWSMEEDCYDFEKISSVLVECDETFKLRPGRYEAYYYVGTPHLFFNSKGIKGLGDLIEVVGDLFSGDLDTEERMLEEDIEELFMIIESEQPAKTYTPEFGVPDGNVVFINLPEADEYHRQGFTLKSKVDLEVYAIGEFSDSYEVFVDGGWIINADSREKVWSMDKWNTDRAGGAYKNRYFRDIITLPPGDYIACYATDDSHDAGAWNSQPPSDPNYYGLSISTVDPDNMKYVSEYDEKLNETEIVSLTRIRDDAFERAGFTLKKDARIHIIGQGERDYSNDFLVDHGWIVDADDFEKVWEMTAENTGHAGGGAKNARFDGIIDLPAGNYIVYYRSDGSHSYRDWNVSPPYDKRAWGIALWGVGEDFDENSFALVDEFQPLDNALVDLTGLGDDEDASRSFELDATYRIRILALGEGMSNDMYDYGWIEDDETGEIVWEMTYRKTKHAGGASKNRMVVANITLEEGKYTAYFVTDGSHSFEDFNASPPDDPERWGMIVKKK